MKELPGLPPKPPREHPVPPVSDPYSGLYVPSSGRFRTWLRYSWTTVAALATWAGTLAVAVQQATSPTGEINWVTVVAILFGGGGAGLGLLRTTDRSEVLRAIAANPPEHGHKV